MGPGGAGLLEREAELALLEEALDAASRASGRLVVIEAPAGLGKTSLLRATAASARARDAAVLEATCGELEQPFPFGACLQIFAGPAARLKGARGLEGGAALAQPLFESGSAAGPQPDEDRMFALFHGLWWLTAQIADERPLLLSVDDAQWADEPSLRFLDFLGRRLADLRVAVLLAVRTGEPGSGREALEAVRDGPDRIVLRPAPLSRAAVAELVRTAYGSDPEELTGALAAATAGNPFYLRQLLDAARDDELEPLGQTGMAAANLDSIAQSVVRRISRLGEDARDLAHAVAVLGEAVPLRRACALADLTAEASARTADRLAAADVLQVGESIGFVHPIVREAVYHDIAASARAVAHADAARILSDERADSELVAAQLLRGERMGQGWAVEQLRRAARRAAERGVHSAAVGFLRRALEEPPAAEERATLLHELGTAEMLSGEPGCVERLSEALDATTDATSLDGARRAQLRAAIATSLSRALVFAARAPEAFRVLRDGIAELEPEDPGASSRLRAELLGMALLDRPSRDEVRGDLDRALTEADDLDDRRDRPLLGVLALEATLGSWPAERAAGLARRALADGGLLAELPPDHVAVVGAIAALQVTDRAEESERVLDQAERHARRGGSVRALAVVTCMRSRGAFRWGALADAEELGRSALRLATEHGWPFGIPVAIACVADPLIERGELDEAAALLEPLDFEGTLADAQLFQMARDSATRLALARGDAEASLRLALACGEWERGWGTGNAGPTHHPWRANAALACLVLGDADRARELAREQLPIARTFGTNRAIGIALRVAGLAEGGPAGLELLAEAGEALERSPCRLEHARALADLGMALRRARRRREARERLYPATKIARSCGATALADLAEVELRAAGAKPRRRFASGAEALTPSERRIAELAASGLGNRAIAQQLFVSRRTVETHLTNAYRKLEITGRDDLQAHLTQ